MRILATFLPAELEPHSKVKRGLVIFIHKKRFSSTINFPSQFLYAPPISWNSASLVRWRRVEPPRPVNCSAGRRWSWRASLLSSSLVSADLFYFSLWWVCVSCICVFGNSIITVFVSLLSSSLVSLHLFYGCLWVRADLFWYCLWWVHVFLIVFVESASLISLSLMCLHLIYVFGSLLLFYHCL